MWKKVVSLVGVTVFVLVTGFAQHGSKHHTNKTPEEVAKMRTKRMAQRLELTDAQTEQVHGILLESAIRKAEIQEQYPEMKKAKEESVDFRKESKEKVHSILTEEQIAKQREIRQGSKHKMKNGEGHNVVDHSARLKKMKTDLDLSDQQEDQLKVVFDEAKKHHAEIQTKYPELVSARDEMKQMKLETEMQLEKVLTTEQYQTWQQCEPTKGKKMKKGMK